MRETTKRILGAAVFGLLGAMIGFFWAFRILARSNLVSVVAMNIGIIAGVSVYIILLKSLFR